MELVELDDMELDDMEVDEAPAAPAPPPEPVSVPPCAVPPWVAVLELPPLDVSLPGGGSSPHPKLNRPMHAAKPSLDPKVVVMSPTESTKCARTRGFPISHKVLRDPASSTGVVVSLLPCLYEPLSPQHSTVQSSKATQVWNCPPALPTAPTRRG